MSDIKFIKPKCGNMGNIKYLSFNMSCDFNNVRYKSSCDGSDIYLGSVSSLPVFSNISSTLSCGSDYCYNSGAPIFGLQINIDKTFSYFSNTKCSGYKGTYYSGYRITTSVNLSDNNLYEFVSLGNGYTNFYVNGVFQLSKHDDFLIMHNDDLDELDSLVFGSVYEWYYSQTYKRGYKTMYSDGFKVSNVVIDDKLRNV